MLNSRLTEAFKISCALPLLASLTSSQSALATESVAFWSFNDLAPETTVTQVNPDFGFGHGKVIGGVEGSSSSGVGFSGIDAGMSWTINEFPAQGLDQETAGVEFHVPTLGYSAIEVQFDQYIGRGSAVDALFQVTYDGINYVNVNSVSPPLASDPNRWVTRAFRSYSIGSGNQNSASNNPNFGFRFVSDFYPPFSSTSYRPTLGSSYSSQSEWRFDNLLVRGTPLFAAGDFNADGLVNAADYTTWRDDLGSTDATLSDANRDRVVDVSDYEIWASNYGNAADTSRTAGDGVSVPEPSAMAQFGMLVFLQIFSAYHRVGRPFLASK